MNTGVQKEEARPRTNGWSCPWHPLQCLAWFFVLFFTLFHFGFLAHYIPGLWRIFIFLVPGIMLGSVVISMGVATTIDPSDPGYREKMRAKSLGGRILRPKFDSSKHKHVIENNYCNLCQVNVTRGAKHCRLCDKCVSDFDHHCKWLNSCVGSRNYNWFLASVWSALISLLMFFLYTLSLFILYFVDRDTSLRFNCDTPSNLTMCDSSLRLLGGSIPDPLFPTLCALLAVLSLIGIGLLGHLALFHVYLKVKGQTTYEFFTDTRRESSDKQTRAQCCAKKKANRVVPVDSETGIASETKAATSIGIASPLKALSNRSSTASNESNVSAGMNTFGRTPPPDGSEGDSFDNRTDEQKLGFSPAANDKLSPDRDDCYDDDDDDGLLATEKSRLMVKVDVESLPIPCAPPSVEKRLLSSTSPSLSPSHCHPVEETTLSAVPLSLSPDQERDVSPGRGSSGSSDDAALFREDRALLPENNSTTSPPSAESNDDHHINSGSATTHGSKVTIAALSGSVRYVELVDRATSPISPLPENNSNPPHSSGNSSSLPASSSQQPPPALTTIPNAPQLMHTSSNPVTNRDRSSPLPLVSNTATERTESPHSMASDRLSRTNSPFPVVSGSRSSLNCESPIHGSSSLLQLQKRVSFQNLNQDEEDFKPLSKPRPLPPILSDATSSSLEGGGIGVISSNLQLSKGRQLPPLQAADVHSLYSTSSLSHISSRMGSTNSLPLPDPRYTTTTGPRTPLSMSSSSGGGKTAEEEGELREKSSAGGGGRGKKGSKKKTESKLAKNSATSLSGKSSSLSSSSQVSSQSAPVPPPPPSSSSPPVATVNLLAS